MTRARLTFFYRIPLPLRACPACFDISAAFVPFRSPRPPPREKELTKAAKRDIINHDMFADMLELADKTDLESVGKPCRFEPCYPHQSNIIRIVYSSRVSGSDLLFILKICNKKRELADFTPQALVPFLSVSNGKPFRFRPQWRYPCVNQWDHSYLIFY